MTTSLFERLRDGAGLRLLQKYGDVFRVTKRGDQVYNPSTGSVTTSTATQDIRGKSFSRDSQFDVPELTETAEIEVYLTASGLTFAPQPGMTIGSPPTTALPYKITRVQPIPESGVVVMYRVIAQR
jgi:hypothetical protein